MSHKLILSLLLLYAIGTVNAQKYTSLSLNDMSAFKSQAGNWSVVSDVYMDRNADVHHSGNTGITTAPGSGILINQNDASKNSALLTNFEHGDLEMELEFMLPKGSNSGIYLQGRYEVQLYDSWGVKNPKFSDLGGIYRNWESAPGKTYAGKAPLANAAKAPGLWQKMYVYFKAPTFDGNGKKLTNAKLNLVKINGTTIHENVEIPLPTGGPIENNEVSKGPLMIQGDHGAVAFRNIKYRLLDNTAVKAENVSYKYWKGPYEYEETFMNLKPTKTGPSPLGITWEMTEVQDYFALQLTGNLKVEKDDHYYITSKYNGNLAVYIDGKMVKKISRAWDWDTPPTAEVDLTKGNHTFDIYFCRADAWVPPSIGIWIEGDNTTRQPLHTFSSFIQRETNFPIYVNADKGPKILRAFLDYKNDYNKRQTHTVGVGDPSGTHYVFNNANGSISCIWKGQFVDATPMWHDRGDGSFKPIGDVIFLNDKPQLMFNNASPTFRSKGYKIDEKTETPIFIYQYGDGEVADHSIVNAEDNSLMRTIEFNNIKNASFKIAEGKEIKDLSNNNYLIDGSYYIHINDESKVVIKDYNGQKALITDVSNGSLKYAYIW